MPCLAHQPRLSLERLNRQAAAQSFDLDALGFDRPIERRCGFVCPTLTPLYYTGVYGELSAPQKLRYNQITGMCFNELIGFFEESFAHTALVAVLQRREVPEELAECLGTFMLEEHKHSEMWRRLNRLSEPDWYCGRDRYIVRVPGPVRWLLGKMARRPLAFPVVLWLMLALEEHSMEISRRCARVAEGELEPHYAAAYRLHMKEEVRHVQIDWHLLERFYFRQPARVRRQSAALFRFLMGRFFLSPTNSAVRVFDLLTREFPELKRLRPRVVRELRGLDGNADYQRMMYSREATPITFGLLDGFEEFRGVGSVLRDYRPGEDGGGSLRSPAELVPAGRVA